MNSRNLLRRKHFKIENDNYNCILCNLNTEEFTYHLFFTCPFSETCWNMIDIHWDHELNFFETIQKARIEWNTNFFMEVFSIAAWEIWKQRNAKVFRNTPATPQSWKRSFICTVQQHLYRLQQSQSSTVQDWINSLL